MMSLFIRVFFLFYTLQASLASASYLESKEVEKLLNGLATTKGMEFVYGDKFPAVNPYGSYGSTFILDFVERDGIESNVFFLARKKNKFHKGSCVEQTIDLIRNYDYFYIYAEKEKNTKNFHVKDIISSGAGLMGLSLFHGWVELKTKVFIYIDTGEKVDSATIDRRKLSTAVLVSSESSTKILFNYKGRWIQSSEIEL